MKKYIKSILATILLIVLFSSYKINITYAYNEEKVDLLIENKKIQDSLKLKIENLEVKIKQNNKIEDNKNQEQVKVVTVSFIEGESTSFNEEDINNVLKAEKEKLEKELEVHNIENVKLQKSIEQEAKDMLDKTNSKFFDGIWPIPLYTKISSNFGERIHPITGKNNFHRGIDIPAPESTDILSIDDGIVTFSGVQNGYGNVVKIQHFDGKLTLYAHNSLNVVKNGDVVKKGQVIAKVGSTGNSTGNHLHFEVKLDNENINPLGSIKK